MLGSIVYRICRVLARCLTFLVCRYYVSGLEHLPATGPLLIVSNHLSWYDPILIGSILRRRIWFFAKTEIFVWPVVSLLVSWTGQIPVRRGAGDRAALEKALSYLKEGQALVIFPEGTVARQEQMLAARTGVAMLALRSGATVLPVALLGTRRILRSRRIWRPSVSVQIGKPYTPLLPEGATRKSGMQIITDEIMQQIATMLPSEQRGAYDR